MYTAIILKISQKYSQEKVSCMAVNNTVLPDKLGNSFHNCGHDHRMQCLPYTSARASASFPFPWALQMNLLSHNTCQKNNQEPDEQQISAKVVSAYLLMQGSVRWTSTAQILLSSHAHYLLCRSETCHNPLSTWNEIHMLNSK